MKSLLLTVGVIFALTFPASSLAFDFTPLPDQTEGASLASPRIVDLNGDEFGDIAVEHSGSGLRILTSDGDGTFTPGQLVSTPTPDSGSPFYDFGDLNGDGHVDIAVARSGSSLLRIWLNDGAAHFTQAADSPVELNPANSPAFNVAGVNIANFAGEEYPQVLVASAPCSPLVHFTSSGVGSVGNLFTPNMSCISSGSGWEQIVRDFNDDGRPDVVGHAYQSSSLFQWSSLPTGFYSPEASMNFPWSPTVVADLNGDGRLDLAAHGSKALGNGVGYFSNLDGIENIYNDPSAPNQWVYAAADFDGDGYTDLLTSDFGQLLRVSKGGGSGGFAKSLPIAPTANTAGQPTEGDIDNDGDVDVVAVTGGGTSMRVYLNETTPALSLNPSSLSWPATTTGSVGETRVLTITNTSPFVIGVRSVSVVGTNNAEFWFTDDCDTLVSNGSCKVLVRFMPETTGTRTAKLKVAYGPAKSTQTIPLAGVGSAPSPGPTGSTGPAGPGGATGGTGLPGPAGPTGAQGPNGTQGPAGTPGPSGANGQDGIAGLVLADRLRTRPVKSLRLRIGASASRSISVELWAKKKKLQSQNVAVKRGRSSIKLGLRGVKPGRYLVKLVAGSNELDSVPLTITR